MASEPGSADRANEDAAGSSDHCAFVIDGATGLGEHPVMSGAGSDSAWLAGYASDFLAKNLTPDHDVRSVVRDCIGEVRRIFDAARGDQTVGRYAWPSASFVIVYSDGERARFAGLGDCTIISNNQHSIDIFSPLANFSSFESDWAAAHLRRADGFKARKDLLSDAETLDDLRKARALQNTPESGVWTLGLEPAAVDHIVVAEHELSASHYCLLCTDGFSALVDSYGAYTPETLLAASLERGLESLIEELRHIENEIDPEGERFPRFKRSDDATALLLKVTV
ncbi:MAG: hypothetical protein ACR2PF_07950 [Rhizobiaceae bacterium]